MNKRILLGIVIFLITMGGMAFWLYQRMNGIMENKELSTQIPSTISELFDRKTSDDYTYIPQEINWNGKYLVFEEYDDLSYHKDRNIALGKHKYFPNEKINGIVLVKPDTKTLGYYKKKDSDKETTTNKAYQNFYAISYFDLNKKLVFAKDTIWGPLPKEWKSNTENQHGILPDAGKPDEDELIEIIKKRVEE